MGERDKATEDDCVGMLTCYGRALQLRRSAGLES